MFTLVISCLTTSNLHLFIELTNPGSYANCSPHHQIFLLSPVPSTTGCCLCFGSIPSFFLELCLHWSPEVYWAPTNLGSSYFTALSFALIIMFTGFSRQEYWRGLQFPSPVDHLCQTSPPWPTCLGWPQEAWLSFNELDKAMVHVTDWLVCSRCSLP